VVFAVRTIWRARLFERLVSADGNENDFDWKNQKKRSASAK
jgi:hypothetical protein